jgi:dCMP deaminase
MSFRLTKTQYFLSLLDLVAERSTCARRKVGAIITDEDSHILSTGYNGVPKGFEHCIDVPCPGASDEPGNNAHCMAVHAEQNALLQCNYLSRAHTMFVSCVPCFICAKMIANTNIKIIVAKEKYADTRGFDVLISAGIAIRIGEQVYGVD